MKIAIVGAGYGGMAAAYDLAKAGHQVTIFEAADHVGGLASGFKEPHWEWSLEKFYHHWFASDAHMLGLINELGLSGNVIFPRPYTVMYYNAKFYPFDSIPAALLYPGLGWGLDKIRFGLVGLYLRITNNWRPLERSTVDAWMRKWAGKRVYESMWLPLIEGKFGPFAKQVNMAWLWARLHARTTRLGTYKGGFQAFADQFAEKLKAIGVGFEMRATVESVKQVGVQLELSVNGKPQLFDQVLVTTSPQLLAKLAPELSQEYLRGLLDLKSMGAVVMTLSIDRQLSEQGYYWYNIPKSAGFPFLALVEHTNYVSSEHFGGDHILYCGDYLELGHEYFTLSDEQLLERFLPGIQRVNPAFERSWVKKVWVHKTNYAQPVPLVNHSRNIPEIATPIPGLYFASMSQVYPWDRGTNFAVEIGRKAANLMQQVDG
ncbi:MAG TPA: NAD(P)/FAD-dependent oxidoreductase [Anaerolineales bacterium]|nr:NAD(P)/FAD-dependent oxidoreductase [Anaerolineales bacterium]HRQ92402.1 NAD(P)/FAD-dependent oxidoreductase [Anaerolineales bacterium]